jgi:hypothetical protein
MPVISIPLLKTKFETGDRPTGADFADLIDTTTWYGISLDDRVESLEETSAVLITGNVTTNSATIIDEWELKDLTTAEYIIQIVQGIKFYCTKMLIMSDTNLINYTKYAIITLGDDINGLEVECSVDASGPETTGQVVVQISDATTTNAVVKVLKTKIA